MKNLSISLKIYIALIIILAILAAVGIISGPMSSGMWCGEHGEG